MKCSIIYDINGDYTACDSEYIIKKITGNIDGGLPGKERSCFTSSRLPDSKSPFLTFVTSWVEKWEYKKSSRDASANKIQIDPVAGPAAATRSNSNSAWHLPCCIYWASADYWISRPLPRGCTLADCAYKAVVSVPLAIICYWFYMWCDLLTLNVLYEGALFSRV